MFRFWGLAVGCLLLAMSGGLTLGCGGSAAPPPSAQSPFQRTEVAGLGDPEVVVQNVAGRPIKVTLVGPISATLELADGETKRAKVKAGSYQYRAEAKGAVAFDGQQEFSPDGRYTWSFLIKSPWTAPPPAMVAQLQELLTGKFTDATVISGVKLGDAASALPPGFKNEGDGYKVYPTGWGVRVDAGKVAAFNFEQNFVSAFQLFEEPDVIAKFGEPSDRVTPPGSEGVQILVYETNRMGFVLNKHKHVITIVFL